MRLDPTLVMKRASCIRLLVLDVDGVLTDGSIVYDAEGSQIQSFHVHDGLGIKLLERAGVQTAIISSRKSAALARRAEELNISFVFQGVSDKISAYNEIAEALGISEEETAYMGDDWVDISMLRLAGLAVVVPDAPVPVKDYAHYVTEKPGGRGAVREVCELILRARGKWGELLNQYAGT